MSTISPTCMNSRAKDWVGHMVDKEMALNFPSFSTDEDEELDHTKEYYLFFFTINIYNILVVIHFSLCLRKLYNI
jgi:hypothetical protein